ncbi:MULTISPECIES: outer membrane beta-barrel protein [unclassified Nitrobacter]|uniref:outer membrane beta-barrel protein n=1 Tax=unclassified Nitrobacter TaxID=2620411 RepID=UPI0003225AD0|nr:MULTISPECIES: outer membrane beta-barrel protein [unclassified Nitrobacter]MCB1393944.1 outer membrane beta-barrel protein [Nitrobacter sp.]MCV0386584.1 outer membrane beta-barrel protein [Nitrobacter sp.]
MSSGPATGFCQRAPTWRAALVCLALIVPGCATAEAQTLTGDAVTPLRGGFFQARESSLRRTDDAGGDLASAFSTTAPSRIGRIPAYDIPAATGAGDTGYDSLNRRRKKPKLYPGAPKPKQPPGPGNFVAVPPPPPLSIPPSSTANTTPIAPAMAGRVEGQPPRRRLKRDDDPFGAVGNYVGSFLVRSAVELWGGYNTNPGRFNSPKGSAFYMVSPEFVAASDWERHSLLVDFRGSFTGFGRTFPPGVNNPAQSVVSVPTNVDRPDFIGRAVGRLDVRRDTRINSEVRLRIGTDNPGSPNVQAGLARYPIFATTGGTAGIEHDINRLQLSLHGFADRTMYQDSQLTDGTSATNADRNFNQYGAVTRASYDLMPGLKPFGEVEADARARDTPVDRFGFQRDSRGGYAKVGTSFELTRLLIGEASIGYTARNYADPRLNQLTGLLTSGSLVWSATALTTAKFISVTFVDESYVPGVSGVLTRSHTIEIDHDFRRWLTGIGRFTYATQEYRDSIRSDEIYSISGDLIYRLNREFQIKAQVRHDVLSTNIPGASSAATVVMLGVRLQR